MVDDGIQPPVELSCKERNILAATFIRSLHKNIGTFGTWAKEATLPTLGSEDGQGMTDGLTVMDLVAPQEALRPFRTK